MAGSDSTATSFVEEADTNVAGTSLQILTLTLGFESAAARPGWLIEIVQPPANEHVTAESIFDVAVGRIVKA